MDAQGYGLTETCAASFVALPRQDNSGTVGPPTAGLFTSFSPSYPTLFRSCSA